MGCLSNAQYRARHGIILLFAKSLTTKSGRVSGFTLSLPNPNAINGVQDISLVMMMPTTDDEIQRMAMTFHYKMALDARQTVLSGIADLAMCPFLDSTKLAS